MADGFSYDVFLSFRGEDTRYGFTGNLWKALHDRGIRTFIDDEELQKGEEITPSLLKAIEESRMAIIVLSRNYASSSFCLNELSMILNCSIEDENRSVWPVFYEVDPSDVRKLTGTYGRAMDMHESRSNANMDWLQKLKNVLHQVANLFCFPFKNDNMMDQLQKWKNALHEVANLSGFHYQKGDGYEHEFIGKIVEQVSKEIKPLTLAVADYLVGLEPQKQNVISLLNVGFDDKVHMVGIHGIGGIGKTTLALAVYNSTVHQFQASCFLEKVRENSDKHGLLYFQKILLSEIVGKEETLSSVEQGISVIKQKLQRKKVLLLLDDVDKEEQLHAIAGRPEWFGLGSRVIITTRDKRLLTCHGVESTYEVQEMNKKDAIELLRLKAFKSDEVCPSYVDVLNRALTYASGLPLALEAIGSHLFNKTIEQCKFALDRYERIPDKKIQMILKVSFDALDEEEKSVFLDIACCFKGYELAMLEKILHAHHGHCKKDHINVLVEKSLIKISESGNVTLHDLIEDMGKEIVRQESPEEPGKRSRLWSPEDIVQVFEKNTGTSKIEIIYLDTWIEVKWDREAFNEIENHLVKWKAFEQMKNLEVKWDGEAFKKMENLRTLIIYVGQFSKSPKHLPNSLRILQLRLSPSGGLRQHDFYSEKFENMRALKQTVDISGLLNLEEFSIENCGGLIKFDDSISLMGKLRILRIKNCPRLTNIPPLKLTSLEELNLSNCDSLESFPPMVDTLMDKLKILSITCCNKLRNIPPIKLASLEKLFILSCASLESLPLVMDGSTGKLKILNVRGCSELKSIPPLKLASLEKLDLLNCGSLENFPHVVDGLMDKLKILRVKNCRKLKNIPPIKLASLEEIDLSQCRSLESFPLVVDGLLDNLKILNVQGCSKLKSIPPLKLASLEKLDLSDCDSLENFPHVVDGLMDKLKILRVKNCSKLKNIPPIKSASLEELDLSQCRSLESFPLVVDGLLDKLKILNVKCCSKLRSIPSLKLTLLEELDLSYCDSLESLPPLVDDLLEKLKILSISHCSKLRSIPPLKLTSLEELNIWYCDSLDSLPPMMDETMRKLKILSVKGCNKFRSIPPLNLASLEELYLSGCDSLESLSPMMDGSLDRLKVLSVECCSKLRSIPPFKLPSLETLDLSYCGGLVSFSPAVDGLMDKLKILRVKSCTKLKNVPPIRMASIEELDLSECHSLESFPPMVDGLLGKFKILIIEGCFKFRSTRPLNFAPYECDCGIAHLPSGIAVVSELTESTTKDVGWLFPKHDGGEEKVSPMQSLQIKILCLCNYNLSDASLAIGLKWFDNVKELYLSENKFTMLPECIENCRFLWKLVLNNCEELQEIKGIPPSLKTLSSLNCKSLIPSCKSKLLNQELHEAGNTWFRLPRAMIPDWFDHQCMAGLSFSFWFRNKFPPIALCVVSPLTWSISRHTVRVIVNGNTFFYRDDENFYTDDEKKRMLPKMYHLHLFHIQMEKFNDNLDKALLKNKWNHAEVDFGFPFHKSGIHILKEKTSVNDIQFTNPEINSISTETTM